MHVFVPSSASDNPWFPELLLPRIHARSRLRRVGQLPIANNSLCRCSHFFRGNAADARMGMGYRKLDRPSPSLAVVRNPLESSRCAYLSRGGGRKWALPHGQCVFPTQVRAGTLLDDRCALCSGWCALFSGRCTFPANGVQSLNQVSLFRSLKMDVKCLKSPVPERQAFYKLPGVGGGGDGWGGRGEQLLICQKPTFCRDLQSKCSCQLCGLQAPVKSWNTGEMEMLLRIVAGMSVHLPLPVFRCNHRYCRCDYCRLPSLRSPPTPPPRQCTVTVTAVAGISVQPRCTSLPQFRKLALVENLDLYTIPPWKMERGPCVLLSLTVEKYWRGPAGPDRTGLGRSQ
eukprot:gene24914-biopygen19463